MGEIKTVLVVDDEEPWIRSVTRRLRGRRVIAARDPDTARELALHEHPELALVDLRLGAANGLDVVGALKADDPKQLVVVMSCWLDSTFATEAIRVGANAVLEKTTDVAYIVECFECGRHPTTPVLDAVPNLDQMEHTHIVRVLAACDGNKSEAARRLGLDRTTLQKKLR